MPAFTSIAGHRVIEAPIAANLLVSTSAGSSTPVRNAHPVAACK
jgi:hypothetical protein